MLIRKNIARLSYSRPILNKQNNDVGIENYELDSKYSSISNLDFGDLFVLGLIKKYPYLLNGKLGMKVFNLLEKNKKSFKESKS